MTAFPAADTVERSVRLGIFAYITKPFTPDQLRTTVSRALAHRKLREETRSIARPKPERREFPEMIGQS